MRMKTAFLIFKHPKSLGILLLLLSAVLLQGQTEVKLTLLDNSETIYSVAAEGKLWFDNGNLLIDEHAGGTNATIPITAIRKITFKEKTSATRNESLKSEKAPFYPNPVSDYLIFDFAINQKSDFTIYNTNGQIVTSGLSNSNDKVDLSGLQQGIYVLTINNQSFKL